jgi:uncharacterized protein (DUF305 family)
MRSRHRQWLTAVLAAASAAPGCHRPSREAAPVPPAASQADAAAMERARADSARYPWTAADARFLTGMIGHHAQAIEMSRLAPTHGASASVKTLAERIINAQEDEIALMRQWLGDRRQPLPEIHPTGMMMDHADHAIMPGMLTAAQMEELDAAKGTEFDRLFLTYMIQHHRGAITMVKELFATPGAAQDRSVFKIASDVNVDQTTEVARMTQMLALILLR